MTSKLSPETGRRQWSGRRENALRAAGLLQDIADSNYVRVWRLAVT
jgi:hypothetical protein